MPNKNLATRLLQGLVLVLALILMVRPAFADRAKIGLVLGGGGAKGSAHLAILQFLESNRIPIDYIAGTSIGAYVGGLYALGHNANEIKAIMYGEDLSRGYSDSISRESLPYRNKRQKDKFNLPVELGYRDGELRFPGGLLYGQTMSSIFLSSVGNLVEFSSFDDLAIPFRAVATDIASGETVTLSKGNLIKAMQASATVPGALVPLEIEGRYLVDGGISDNIPVAQVKQMGADIVIAVDISAPLLSKQQLGNSLAVLRQLSTILTNKNITQQKLLLGEQDIYIRPDVSNLSFTDFSNLQQAYDAGRDAVLNKREALVSLSINAADYAEYSNRKQQSLITIKQQNALPLAELELRNNSAVNDDYLLKTLGIKNGKPVSNDELKAGIDRVYALDRFERVEAEFEQRNTGRALIINVKEKSWGPNFFELGLGWEDDFTLGSTIYLDLAYTLGDITGYNGEWRNEIGIGTDKSFASELYLPVDAEHSYYNFERYEFNHLSRNYFIDNQRATIFEETTHQFKSGFGHILLTDAVIETGITLGTGDIANQLVPQNNLNYQSHGVFLRLAYDSLDHLSFPSTGQRYDFTISHRQEDVSGTLVSGAQSIGTTYFSTQYSATWKAAVTYGNHGLSGIAALTYLESEGGQSIFSENLGGFLNLSGYHKNALVGNNKAFAAMIYQYDLGKSVFGLKDFPLYVGGSIELGNVWSASQSISFGDLITANSLFIATKSALGPVSLGLGFSENNISAVYFYLGKNI